VQPIKPASIKPIVSFDVLDRIDIRVGTIERVEDVADSDKLVRPSVAFGNHKRRILVGMKQERKNPKEVEDQPTPSTLASTVSKRSSASSITALVSAMLVYRRLPARVTSPCDM